ncbi:MAG: DUF2760 domain-containing protein [Methylococcaceae bacterium]|nr:DUF2760 domain-containing protein [Methylococcaceae bacterium]
MNIDLSLIPDTFDAVHAGLAATVIGLLFLQILFLTVAFIAVYRKPSPGKTLPEEIPASESIAAKPLPSAAQAARIEAPQPALEQAPEKSAPVQIKTVVVKEATPDAALQLLGLLQKEARFIDFIQENVSQYSDTDIGAAARVVHEGCRKVLRQHFELAPVRTESEGSRITLSKGFDASRIRLTGNIVGEAPFTGNLVHRGWKATQIKLPKITEGHDVSIIATAEVEL